MRAIRPWIRLFGALCGLSAVVACPPSGTPLPPTPPTATVTVAFPNATPTDRPLLLYSGQRDGACREYEPHVGTTSPSITLASVQYDSGCQVEIDVFAPAWGAFGRRLTISNPADSTWWANARATRHLTIELPTVTPIPTTLWIVSADATGHAQALALLERQLSAAAPVLEELGAGVTLGHPTPIDLDAAAVPPDCAKADVISTTPAIYNAATLNVYYVENYLNQPYSSYAKNCWMEGHPEIIFVSWGNENNPDPVLAHEVGHALGLFHPEKTNGLSVGGHTNNLSSFDDDNLMYTGAPAVVNVSIGQSYALNFSQASWFNRTGSTVSRPVVQACQDSWGAGPCPDLTMFVAGWPK
jgi:hypothetical protein